MKAEVNLDPAVAGPDASRILTPEAIAFCVALHERFADRRHQLLERRHDRQQQLDAGERLDFLAETAEIRDGDWTVAPAPDPLVRRGVEITGPTDRKMVINALNSGAGGFMADFEDANSPTWRNLVSGQANLIDALERSISFEAEDGRTYELEDDPATLLVRPRGWHLPERHMMLDGIPAAGALVDFGLHAFHNASHFSTRGSGPYFYLPKMESHLEARLWAAVFDFAEDALGLDRGSIRATVLIETLPAAFEMEEILYELREHSAGLNAGRWDYIFSAIKSLRAQHDLVLPDRQQVTMTVPFMHAYTELLVSTCHRRGAHAIGGMAAFIPSRRDPAVNEIALDAVRKDKAREAAAGFDGTWVAHPDLVPVAAAELDRALGDRPNQLARSRDDVEVRAEDLLDVVGTPGEVTEEGLRNNISVGIQYISSWLGGLGAVAINNLMEDAATAEIARAQVWQWIHHDAKLDDATPVTEDLVRRLQAEELEKIREAVGDELFYGRGRAEDATHLFERVSLSDELLPFLTLPAYALLG